jgi:hypothetical protein
VPHRYKSLGAALEVGALVMGRGGPATAQDAGPADVLTHDVRAVLGPDVCPWSPEGRLVTSTRFDDAKVGEVAHR